MTAEPIRNVAASVRQRLLNLARERDEDFQRGLMLAVAGIVLGAAAAAVLSNLLRSVLYGISTIDPIAFAGAAVMLLGVAFLANYIPARRAARIDPMTALRNE